MPLDNFFANWIRSQNTPVILVANKCEGKAGEPGLYESYKLGLGEPTPISAEHGEGLADLYTALLPYAEKLNSDLELSPRDTILDLELSKQNDSLPITIQMAIVGRPNVGKSTLVNTIVGEERLLTGPEAGITRDSIAVEWEYNNLSLRLIDTAGIRRRSKIQDKIETLSTRDSFRAIQYAQIAVSYTHLTLPTKRIV